MSQARVPLVKCRHVASGVAVDVVVNNDLGVHNSAMLYEYASLDWRARALALVVKKWAKQQQVADASAGTLSSYCWVLMALHYCMAHGIIACLTCQPAPKHQRSTPT